jgi:deoxycytidylate deaminase
MPENTDDFIARAKADDLKDQLEAARNGFAKMSVREYAIARGLQPQLVYYYVRMNYIKVEPCENCGRKVIDIKSADEYIADMEAKKK